jgi:DNA segregation ATPase FtsK/SpoIIIE-like protein
MQFLGKKYKKKKDIERIKQNAAVIEQSLEALGFTARVAEANIRKGFDEFYLEVAVGTDVNKLEKHDRALALALKSPTGKIEWQFRFRGLTMLG